MTDRLPPPLPSPVAPADGSSATPAASSSGVPAPPAVASASGTSGTPAPATPGSHRLDSIDLLRGFVMVVMALDHVRDHLHREALVFDPTDLSRASAALFLTRWITHLCAPVFVFLAGTGAFLWGARGRSKAELSRYLLTRGLWLVLLELTIVNWEWQMGIKFDFLIAQVIWVLGWSMVVLAALVHLPTAAIAVIGWGMIALHNLFDGIRPESLGAWGSLWKVLHVQGSFEYAPGFTLFVMYPLKPWVGVMAAGYAFGALFTGPVAGRRGKVLRLGAALTALFVLVRATNLYGDPGLWSVQRDGLFTVLSFINCQKYPPSLLFLLMTLGPSLLLLALWEGGFPRWFRPLVVFGRVPLFFYVVHLALIDLVTVGFAIGRYGSRVAELFAKGIPPDYGYGLPLVYGVWVGVVLALYPVCRWYAGIKARRKSALLSYL